MLTGELGLACGQPTRDKRILARKLYQELVANGWEETLRRRKGLPAEKKVNMTIGGYLDAVKSKSLIHSKTIERYGAALRKIASDIHDVTDKKRATWRAISCAGRDADRKLNCHNGGGSGHSRSGVLEHLRSDNGPEFTRLLHPGLAEGPGDQDALHWL